MPRLEACRGRAGPLWSIGTGWSAGLTTAWSALAPRCAPAASSTANSERLSSSPRRTFFVPAADAGKDKPAHGQLLSCQLHRRTSTALSCRLTNKSGRLSACLPDPTATRSFGGRCVRERYGSRTTSTCSCAAACPHGTGRLLAHRQQIRRHRYSGLRNPRVILVLVAGLSPRLAQAGTSERRGPDGHRGAVLPSRLPWPARLSRRRAQREKAAYPTMAADPQLVISTA